jgi:hypothetical protein
MTNITNMAKTETTTQIKSEAELAATLDYIAKWADTLEGMRRHEAEQGTDNNGNSVFLTLAAGPLQEIRTNLEAARAFAHAEKAPVTPS